MSTPLAQLETLFWHTARGTLDAHAVRGAFRSDGAIDAVTRMAIYRDMYFGRQIEALLEDFPVLARALGEPAFRALGREYLLAHPSEAPGLEWVGRRFPSFLSACGVARDLAELAVLERAACEALLAPHDAHASASDVSVTDWPCVRLNFVRSLRVVHVELRAYARFCTTPSVPTNDGGASDVCVVLWRKGYGARHVALEPDEHHALMLARTGKDFAALCASLGNAARAYTVIRSWLAREWIATLEVRC